MMNYWPSRMLPLVLATIAALCIPSAAAIVVDGDNTSGVEDGSSTHPYRRISGGLTEAASGDTVLVLPGTYSEAIAVDTHDPGGMNVAAVVMPSGVVLASQDGPDSTTIHTVGAQAVVYFDSCDSLTELRGFTLESSGTGWGVRTSILCWGLSPLIESNVMLPPYSGILSRVGSTPVVSGNTITGGDVTFYSGSGGEVMNSSIDGTVGVDSRTEPAQSLLVQSNQIFTQGRRPYEDAGVVVAWGVSGEVRVLDNVISGKQVGARLCYAELHGNRFVNNETNVRIEQYCEVRSDVNAEANWWGTTDAEEIRAKIVDCEDDPEIPGCVDYEPWCIVEDCSQTPTTPRSWGCIKALFGKNPPGLPPRQ